MRWLRDRIRERGDAPALVWRDEAVSGGELLERASGCGAEMDGLGVPRGAVVGLEGDLSPATCSLLLALIDRAAVCVPLASAAPAERDRFLEIAGAEWVAAPGGRGWTQREPFRPPHDLVARLRADGEAGLVLFTSGSTGEPKAALHAFPRLLEKFREPRKALRTLVFLLLDHIGGVNTLFHVLANGGTAVAAERRDPDAVCAAIARWGVQLLPTTPTFLNLLLLSEAHTRHDLSSLEQITYGTEPMPQATLDRLRQVLPGARLSQTYGLSELGILRVRSESSGSLRVQLGGAGVETRVVDGTLRIRTPSAMLGYLNAASPFDAEGWYDTEDEVLQEDGWCRLLGRRSEIINVGGQKVYPVEVESVLLTLPNVREAAVVGEPHPLTGQIVAGYLTLRQPEPTESVRRRLRHHCSALLPSFKVPQRIAVVDGDLHSVRFKKTIPRGSDG